MDKDRFRRDLGGLIESLYQEVARRLGITCRARRSSRRLHGLGWPTVANARVGRTIEFDLAETDAAKAEAEVKAMCEKLLANTVIESYRVEVA
jgi:phosphoribosylformylglycinamidine synthase PurS subunit